MPLRVVRQVLMKQKEAQAIRRLIQEKDAQDRGMGREPLGSEVACLVDALLRLHMILCYIILYYVMLCYVKLCYIMLYHISLDFIMLYYFAYYTLLSCT